MKQEQLTYEGFINGKFCFIQSNGQKITFSKSNKDLIEHFDLKGLESSIGKVFSARYFVESTIISDIYILCDLEEVKG
ncbi:MAG: hypothetical protein P8I55_11235 [Crocinitomix sp.]|nr:hypothetical protein [Crocinitomix sp.]